MGGFLRSWRSWWVLELEGIIEWEIEVMEGDRRWQREIEGDREIPLRVCFALHMVIVVINVMPCFYDSR